MRRVLCAVLCVPQRPVSHNKRAANSECSTDSQHSWYLPMQYFDGIPSGPSISVQEISLAAIFGLLKEQPGVNWRLVPAMRQVHAAMQELADSGDAGASVRGVPVFRGEGLSADMEGVRAAWDS